MTKQFLYKIFGKSITFKIILYFCYKLQNNTSLDKKLYFSDKRMPYYNKKKGYVSFITYTPFQTTKKYYFISACQLIL